MLLPALILALQAAPSAPDIALDVHATVREMHIRQRGEASLQVHAAPDANSRVAVNRPDSNGRTNLRNVTVDVHAEARIADPAANVPPAETPRPD